MGADFVDKDGHDGFDASKSKEFEELETMLRPRGQRVLFGAWDPEAPPVGIGERLLRFMSTQTVHHAHCPVLVLRDGAAEQDD